MLTNFQKKTKITKNISSNFPKIKYFEKYVDKFFKILKIFKNVLTNLSENKENEYCSKLLQKIKNFKNCAYKFFKKPKIRKNVTLSLLKN